MLSLGEIRQGLMARCIARVAEDTGIHYNVVWRIANGVTADPKQITMQKLSDYIRNDK